jgi:hypothetical protein
MASCLALELGILVVQARHFLPSAAVRAHSHHHLGYYYICSRCCCCLISTWLPWWMEAVTINGAGPGPWSVHYCKFTPRSTTTIREDRSSVKGPTHRRSPPRWFLLRICRSKTFRQAGGGCRYVLLQRKQRTKILVNEIVNIRCFTRSSEERSFMV